MKRLDYRKLELAEADLLGTIDRSEHIDGFYKVVDGQLELEPQSLDVPTWSGAELDAYIQRVRSLIESGGTVFSAWDGTRLVGIGTLDPRGVGGDPTFHKLDMLYVSADCRGHGVGRALTDRAIELARSLGAQSLYVSATPTRNTVDAYLRMGATLLAEPDPALFAFEPEDIHLVLRI